MPITTTVAELAAAARVGGTAEELAEVSRILAQATTLISSTLGAGYAAMPNDLANMALIQLGRYMYDMPTASRGVGFASILRFSGASLIIAPFRVHGAGLSGGDMVAAANDGMGTPGNPVIDVTIIAGELVVTFADGTTTREDLPEDDTMPDTLMTVGNFAVTDVAADIAAAFTNGSRYRAQATESGSGPVLYAFAAAAPTDRQDYFVLEGFGTFDFVGGVSCWVVTNGAIPGETTNLAIALVT